LSDKKSTQSFDLRDPDTYLHWSQVTIRFGDEDRLGHVNNASYAVWFEAARVEYFTSLFTPEDRLDTVLAQLLIDYVQETSFPGTVEIGSRLLSIGNKSVRSGYGVFREGQCLATCECVNVFFDPSRRESVVPPPAVRQAIVDEIAR
jgi:acyl-CoA thioester hydrolase